MTVLLVTALPAHASPAPAAGGGAADSERGGGLRVRASADRLSVALESAPIPAVLDAVRDAAGVAVRAHGPVEGTVTDRFDGLPIEAGLRRLLRSLDVAFVYDTPGSARAEAPRLAEVLVYAPRRGSRRASPSAATARDRPYPPGAGGGTGPAADEAPEPDAGESPGDDDPEAAERLTALLADPDPAVRQRALEAAEVSGALPAEALGRAALADPDVQVRRAAVAALVATEGLAAASAVVEAALGDPTAAVRLAALEALAEQIGGPAAYAAVRAALADPDPSVRTKASELMRILEEAQQPDRGDDEEGGTRRPGRRQLDGGRAREM